ncbi:uncharacterized protein SPPG_01861 [Spizellomyces punctatus DAOM BR117]|uniref:F-box domain-containing protein n=1 Tax=Spizellomyces punctatus (strain DAOM BR117) TaxID=645134 RepID=A0A0L0HP84_SPIPD|nr:uncharacterized protein SPPG_01861 [Spizellomyces punctatus DAOM BR117]KND02780.1 hypothetical protein SPPG_01861 [Spizellomyces punctatus DAOM BR117]|eukprot:XP_016610819.1 hypothetical protein SPPG_01861 [Spizellomyces punctatus DAOM BR117]
MFARLESMEEVPTLQIPGPFQLLDNLPTELIHAVTLHCEELPDFLSLSRVSRSTRAALWTPAFRKKWFQTHASATLSYFKIAAILCIPLPATELSTFLLENLEEAPNVEQQSDARSEDFDDIQASMVWVWKDAMPWFLRLQILTMGSQIGGPTSFAELGRWFGIFCTSPLYPHSTMVPAEVLRYAWLASQFDIQFADKFCHTAFAHAFEQRGALFNELGRSAQTEQATFTTEFRDFQRFVQSKIISTGRMEPDGTHVFDSVQIY